MSKPIIELITCQSGGYEILRVNYGEDFERRGDSLANHHWIELLKLLGYKIEEIEVSDEDMENNY